MLWLPLWVFERFTNAFSTAQEELKKMEVDYLITDSANLAERPTLLNAVNNPRDYLSLSLLSIGAAVSVFNVLGLYNDAYDKLVLVAIILGLLNSFASALQISTGYKISSNDRPGLVNDKNVNHYASGYVTSRENENEERSDDYCCFVASRPTRSEVTRSVSKSIARCSAFLRWSRSYF